MTEPHSAHLLVTRADGIVTITINRPEKRNALHLDTFRELTAHFDQIAQDPADRVVIVTGSGGFSSGGEIPRRSPDEPPNTVAQSMTNLTQVVGNGIRAVAECPKPVIAAIDGFALGAGVSLALVCDLSVATQDSFFALPFIRHGLGVDSGLSWTLPRAVGLQKAKELAFLGERFTAQQAHDFGLLNTVVANETELHSTTMRWAEALVKASPTALQLMKRSFQNAATSTLAEALAFEGLGQVIGTRSGEVTA